MSFKMKDKQFTKKRKKYYLKKYPNENRIYKLIPLTLEISQNTNVYRKINFLCCKEINILLKEIENFNLDIYTNSPGQDYNSNGDPIHVTTYINSNNHFSKLIWLRDKVINLVHDTNIINKWSFNTKSINFNIRVVEYHEYKIGASLPDNDHYDKGSLITVDIMLEKAEVGADFQTLDNNHEYINHEFNNGDALVFVSHKYHRVSELKKGSRKVMVIEFWNGNERYCGHRCDLPYGTCSFVN
jgi:hypothetical protein